MYKIIEKQNYRGEKIHILMKGNICLWTISPKDLKKLIDKGISFNDSEKIEQFKNIYNL